MTETSATYKNFNNSIQFTLARGLWTEYNFPVTAIQYDNVIIFNASIIFKEKKKNTKFKIWARRISVRKIKSKV